MEIGRSEFEKLIKDESAGKVQPSLPNKEDDQQSPETKLLRTAVVVGTVCTIVQVLQKDLEKIWEVIGPLILWIVQAILNYLLSGGGS